MIKLLFKFFSCDEQIVYSTEPHQFDNWNDAYDFGAERSQEIMAIYNLMGICWDYEEITNNPPEVQN